MPAPYDLLSRVRDVWEAIIIRLIKREIGDYADNICKSYSGKVLEGDRIEIICPTLTPVIHGVAPTGEMLVNTMIRPVSHYVDQDRSEHAKVAGAISAIFYPFGQELYEEFLLKLDNLNVPGIKVTMWMPDQGHNQGVHNTETEYETTFQGVTRCYQPTSN